VYTSGSSVYGEDAWVAFREDYGPCMPISIYPDDLLAKPYLDRALEYEQQPPDEAWDAVEVVFKKK
jgi:hypothetical protein